MPLDQQASAPPRSHIAKEQNRCDLASLAHVSRKIYIKLPLCRALRSKNSALLEPLLCHRAEVGEQYRVVSPCPTLQEEEEEEEEEEEAAVAV